MRKIFFITFLFFHSVGWGQNTIRSYEYWFDGSFAVRQQQSVTPIAQYSLNTSISAASLTQGLHSFNLRFKDDSARFSSTITQFFYKVAAGISSTTSINAYQYWFDNNFAGSPLQTVTETGILNLELAVSAAALTNGLHLFHLRFRDNSNQWSSTLSQFVYKSTAAVTANNAMSKMQYWFDDHFDSAASKAIAVQPIVSVTDLLSTTSLPDGLHTLHLRFADTIGQWSSTLSQFFYKSAAIGVTTNVVSGYRYWYNNEDATKMVIHSTPPQNPFLLNINIDMGCLTVGENRIHLQFKDANGFWSSALTDTVTTSAVPSIIYRFIGNGNWSNAANWQNNAMPALDLPGCKEIIIDNAVGGQCILDVPQNLLKNAKLTVLTGKHLVIPQNLEIQ